MRLNLGCRDDILEGYENIDLYWKDPRVINKDVRELEYEPGTVGEIRAHSFLEHLTIPEGEKALAQWCKWLAVGGTISIIVPDLEMAPYFIGKGKPEHAIGLLYGKRTGEPDDQGQEHKSAWWANKLSQIMTANRVEPVEWKKWIDDIWVIGVKQ